MMSGIIFDSDILKATTCNFSFPILLSFYRNLLVEAHKVDPAAPGRGACAESSQLVSGQGGEMLLLVEWH